jgi:hypothetical protein
VKGWAVQRAGSLLALWASVAAGAEVRITFPVVQRLMAEQVFTQEGRRYVSGDRSRRCDYAYLENPRVGEWNGLLIIKARFSGRKAFDVMGRCEGLGDEIDLTIAATPVVKRGVLALTDVKVDTGGKDSYYTRRVSSALRESLEKQFGLDVAGRARELLEQKDPKAGFVRDVSAFEFRQVKVGRDAVVLDVDFSVTVR